MSINDSIIEVVFKVHADVRIGEEIRLSGNAPVLGCDDPARAVPLVTSPGDFPWWHTKEGLFLPGNPDLRYRYCVFIGGKFDRWEGNGKLLRSLDLLKSKSITKQTEDNFGVMSNNATNADIAPGRFLATEKQSRVAKMYADWNKRPRVAPQLSGSDGVIIVSYFLPVIMSRNSNGKWSATWEKENLLTFQLNARTSWVGSVRYQNAPIPPDEEEAVTHALADMNCYPVFISQSNHFQFYDVYCKQQLWPVMHHIADVYGPLNMNDIGAKAQQNLWFVYSTVHKIFREKVLELYQHRDLIWIHGFHLLLLPSFLRRRLPAAKIGYFMHTPFPSSEIWRTISRREDLLLGILGADQIGFHLYEYARHFLTNCQRLMGCGFETSVSGKMALTIDGREVQLTCLHVGVDVPRIDAHLSTAAFESQMRGWKERFAGKIVVAGIDRLERLKGIPLKLMAIDQFLEENPEWLGKIVFTLVGISAGERGQDYRQTQHDVKILVRELNSRHTSPEHPDPPVYFEERHDRDIQLAWRLPFFASADILMMTATRDGLNRYPMEYTLARHRHGEFADINSGIGQSNQGLVIISEFVSSARVMRGALNVNPWRVQEVKLALLRSLDMDPTERADRMRRNLEYSLHQTTSMWATQVLSDLKSVEKNELSDASYALGFGMNYKVMDLKAGFNPLDVKDVCKSYRTARRRLILLDWGGTLVAAHEKSDKLQAYAMATGHAARDSLPTELRQVLETLAADPKNYIFIVSGKEQPAVAKYFGDIRGLGLGAEHGFYYKWPREDDQHLPAGKQLRGNRWQTIMEVGDQSWKESAKVVMDIFVQRTYGTYIETKGNALIWQYSEADPEFGYMQSKELVDHLSVILAPYAVEVIRGGGVSDGYIEVRPTGANKGLFLEHCLSTLRNLGQEADFVMAVGDDSSDEPMFQAIAEGMKALHEQNTTSFAVTVGKKPTAAAAYIDDTNSVLELLVSMSKCSDKVKRYFSAMDLPSQAKQHAGGLAGFAQTVQQEHAQQLTSSPTPSSQGASLMRSSSAGDFGMRSNGQRKSSTAPSAALTALLREPLGEEKAVGNEIQRMNSSMNLSMMDYMKSLNESNQEDDGAIFF